MKPVDTNILVPMIIDNVNTPRVEALGELDPNWRTESFARVELSSVIFKYVRSGELSTEEALDRFALAEEVFRDMFVHVEDGRALELALEYDVSPYDARFLALAENLGVPLVTEDARLRKAAPQLMRSFEQALPDADES